MKTADFMQLPLTEALKSLTMVDCKIHTNKDGQVIAVELKYTDIAQEDTGIHTREWGDKR